MTDFSHMLKERQELINEFIRDINLDDIHSLLEVPTKYTLLTGGKRLRPIICMLCAEMSGGDYKDTKEAFMALELIHNGTLVHDDIIDEDLFRRGNPSVHVKFGAKKAILTGDAILSLGLKYAAKTGNIDIVSWLSETSLKMVQGVALQTYYRRKITSEEMYLDLAYLKSGSLFEAAAAIGGLVSNVGEESVKVLADFGKNFGIAYQIRDDVCGVFSRDKLEELTRNDILNGDLTLPLIYALDSEYMTNEDKGKVMNVYLGKTEEMDGQEIQRIYYKTGALERATKRMNQFAEMGSSKLNYFEDSGARDCIQHLINYYYKDFNPKNIESML